MRDFRRHLKNGRRAPNTIDTYLSAIDDFTDGLQARADWKGAGTHAALFLNHRGGRLSDRAPATSPASATPSA